MHIYFMTGYPGFLASRLIEQLMDDHRESIGNIYLLVLPQLEEEAIREITHLARKKDLDPDVFTTVTGDITQPGLALQEDVQTIARNAVTHVFHLAAMNDLSVPSGVAWNVNVKGTRHVNEFVQALPHLERYIYFSTAYISGMKEGYIYETELETGQDFRNHYEETKFDAEVMVETLKPAVPTTIIRPSMVKGDSQTGATTKFDGLYSVLNMLDRLSRSPIVPELKSDVEGNAVPVDYVVEATSYLALSSIGEGKTYHLTDPAPYTMTALYRMLCKRYLGRTPQCSLPISWAKTVMSAAPARKWLRSEKDALAYFLVDASYDASQTIKDLEGTGIVCPDMTDTLDSMVDFYRKYKDDYKRHAGIM